MTADPNMAEEVYKILQSRLRKQAQHDSTCSNQYDCEGCRQSKQQAEECTKKKRPSTSGEDPLSHKIIEKRRRDRMNSCLADLSHLIPSNYLKKGRGRIEKTEIVEMAIKHIKHLHELLPSPTSSQSNTDDKDEDPRSRMGSNWKCPLEVESFKNGFNECMAETVHCLVEKEHIPPENPLCSRLVTHLKRHLELKGHSGKKENSAEHVADSDYSSIRSESSATNSEVSSVVSATSASAVSAGGSGMNLQRNSLSRPSSSSSYVIAEGKRRSSDEMPSSGKFKFKDSIRERFSHEFESQTVDASIDHHHSSTDHHHHHEDYQAKRRRTSRACDKEDDKHYVSQSFNASKIHPATETPDKKKSVPIFALHPKGSHYIPLSVSDDVIQPYVHLFEQGSEVPLMLHPITISVNFCGPIRIAAEVRQQRSSHRLSVQESESSLNIKEDREN